MFGKLRGNALSWAICIVTAMAQLLFGYDLGVMGGLVSHPSFQEAFGNPSTSMIGTIVAIYNIGSMLGCIVIAIIGDKLARHGSIFAGCIIVIIGATLQATSFGVPQLIVARIVTGFGTGFISSTVPTYVSESAKPQYRGTHIAAQIACMLFGVVIAYWTDYACIKTLSGQVVWRFPVAFQIFFVLLCSSLIFFLPESPRWLYTHGHREKAVNVFSRLAGVHEDSIEVLELVAEVEEALKLEDSGRRHNRFDWRHIIWDKSEVKNTRRLVLAFAIGFFQEMGGVSVITYFSSILFSQNLGFSLDESLLLGGFLNLVYFCGALPPIWGFDRFGHRPVLILGSIMTTLSYFQLIVLANIRMVLFTIGLAVNNTAGQYLAMVMIFLFVFAFGGSWLTIPYLYSAEIMPLHLRHVGGATGVFSVWLWAYVVVQITPPAIANTGWKIYIFFSLINLISIPFVYFCMPETKGKTLEEIDYIFVTGERRRELEERFEEAKRREAHRIEKTGLVQTVSVA